MYCSLRGLGAESATCQWDQAATSGREHLRAPKEATWSPALELLSAGVWVRLLFPNISNAVLWPAGGAVCRLCRLGPALSLTLVFRKEGPEQA